MAQTLRCVIHHLGDISEWKAPLATVGFAINSLPNRSIGYSPFYLNYGYLRMVPNELRNGDEVVEAEVVSNFVQRLGGIWRVAQQNLEVSEQQQKKHYYKIRRGVQFVVGDLVLLSPTNFRVKNVPVKL